MKYVYLNDLQIKLIIESRNYLVEVDAENQVIQISADDKFGLPGIRKAIKMTEDFGKIAYWFQHIYKW